MHLTLASFLMFFLLIFQSWSKTMCIKVDGNQIKDLALLKFLSRLGQGYYLYSENLRHAKSLVSYTECHYFLGGEPALRGGINRFWEIGKEL